MTMVLKATRIWRKAFCLLLFVSNSILSLSQTLYGTLSNFDVLNDTNETCHGFEIEIEDVQCSQITYTFGYPWSRYGNPSLEPKLDSNSNSIGCYVRYRSQYDNVTKMLLQQTVKAPKVQDTGGHACYNGGPIGAQYDTSGCEHFGLGLNYNANPTKTTYRWLVMDPSAAGQLKQFGTNVLIPAVSWNAFPAPNPAQPAAQVKVVQAEIEDPPNPICSKYGEVAIWVKVFQRESPEHMILEELVSDNPAVPQGNDTAEVEIEWQIRQAQPTCDEQGNPLPANNSMVLEKELGEGSNALTKRYEFYKYTGAYDPENNEALPVSESPPDANDLGSYIGSQMAAANLVMPLAIFSGSLPKGEVGVAYSFQLVTGGLDPYDIAISGNNTPDGLTINSTTGEISGLPTAATKQPSLISLSVVDANGTMATSDISIDIALPLGINTQSLPSGEIDVSYSSQLISTGGVPPMTWSLNGTLPSGLSLDPTTGLMSGIPKKLSDVGVRTLIVIVIDALLQQSQRTIPLTIIAPPSITTISLPAAEKGVTYSTMVAAVDGMPPLAWSVIGLPSGLSLNPGTGEISGSPSVFGTYPMTFTVTDLNMKISAKSLTLTVADYISISTSSLPNGVVGTTYSTVLAASGGVLPLTWSLNTTLPSGLSLTPSTGLLSGKPTGTGTYYIAFTVQDALQQKSLKSLALTIVDPVVITTSSLPNGAVGKAYSATLSASGGTLPFSWSITGTLPLGVTLDSATGILSGSPTQFGSFTSLKVTVMDANLLKSTKTMQLTVVSPISISTSSLTNGISGVAYSSKLSASGGLSPYTWAIVAGTLPLGLSFDSTTAYITGIPTVIGSSNVTFGVQDVLTQTAMKSFILLVEPPLTITSTDLPKGAIGLAYSSTLTTVGGVAPFKWDVTSDAPPALPPGISLNMDTGTVSGTPTVSGSYTMTFKVRDSQNSDTDKDLTIIIVPPLNIATTSLPPATAGVSYSVKLAATGGEPPLTWSVTGAIPAGLSFNTSTAVISGIPSTSTSTSLSFSVLDRLLQTAQKALTMTVLVTPMKPTSLASPTKPAAPIMPPVKPVSAPVKLAPAPAPVKPAPAPVKPAPAPVKPAPAPVKPAPAPVKPALAPVKPATAPVKPVASPVKPSPTKPK